MSKERVIPTSAPSDLPTLKILIDGSEITNAYQIVSVDVNKVFNKISNAKISVVDGDPGLIDAAYAADLHPGHGTHLETLLTSLVTGIKCFQEGSGRYSRLRATAIS